MFSVWTLGATTWYLEDWTYFIKRLKRVEEGDGSWLNHNLFVGGSSGTVNTQNNTELSTMFVSGHKISIKH